MYEIPRGFGLRRSSAALASRGWRGHSAQGCTNHSDNPNGIASSSPGLIRAGQARSYPGSTDENSANPNGVVTLGGRPQPRWGWKTSGHHLPKVARAAQPWALFRNPVGILKWSASISLVHVYAHGFEQRVRLHCRPAPKGRTIIARRFNAGLHHKMIQVLKGRPDSAQDFSRPCGTQDEIDLEPGVETLGYCQASLQLAQNGLR